MNMALGETTFGKDLDGVCTTLVRSWTGSFFPCLTGPTRSLETSTLVQPESFTAMLVGDLLLHVPGFRALTSEIVHMLENELGDDDVFFFFKDHARLPADADCTAVGLSLLLRAGADVREKADAALTRIRTNCDARGVVETYFDPTGERAGIIDPVVCANVLYLACQLGRERELEATLEFVFDTLATRAYLGGTRYYPSPDSFLYFTARLVGAFPRARASRRLRALLERALIERIGQGERVVDLAERVLACAWLGVVDRHEAAMLARTRNEWGWAAEGMFQYGRSKVHFGSVGLSTAFATSALHHAGMLGLERSLAG
jgi:hypothetical protein